jgi:hypothetical protein
MVVPGALRTWKLIEDGGPGERGWLAAQGVLLQCSSHQESEPLVMQLQGLCSRSSYQPGAGVSLVILQEDSQEKQRTA